MTITRDANVGPSEPYAAAAETNQETFELDSGKRLAVLRHICHSHVTDDEIEALALVLRRPEIKRRIDDHESQTNIPSEGDLSNESPPIIDDHVSERFPPSPGVTTSPNLTSNDGSRNVPQIGPHHASTDTTEQAEETTGQRPRPNRSRTMVGAVEEISTRERDRLPFQLFSNPSHPMMTDDL